MIRDGAHAHPATHVEDTCYLAVDGVAAGDDFVQDRVDGLLLKDVALAEAREKVAKGPFARAPVRRARSGW
jgi:hypothetical protein